MSQATLLPSSSQTPSFPPVSYKGMPVMTTEMLAHAYGVGATNIRKNFSMNANRFVEGSHFFSISGNELKEFKNCVTFSNSVKIPHQTRKLTLWTDRGAARHAKMLETDTAWDVYELLEDTFFNVKPKSLPPVLTPSTTDSRRPLEKLIKVWASQAGMPHAQAWTQVNAHFNLGSVTELPVEWIPDAIAFVEGKIDGAQKALTCAEPVLDPAVYATGKRIFDMMAKLMRDFDLVKTHVQLWAHPGGRYARLSPELETIYQNAADASKMALCSLNQAQFALRIAMGIKAAHKFDVR